MNSRRLLGLALMALALGVFPSLVRAQAGAPQRSTPSLNPAPAAGGVRQIEYPRLDADLNEPNDDPSTATWISYNDFQPGLIDPPGDVDYYAFYGYSGDVILADTDAATAGSPLDTTLTLYDQDSVTQLAYDDDSGADTDSRLGYTLPAEGWYFLKVAAASPADGSEEHAYWLFLSLADVYEPNNRISRSTLIAAGDEVSANISPPGDVDYYRFYGTAGEALVIDIDAYAVGSWVYPIVTLYGSDGFSQLARQSYLDNGSDPYFLFTVPADGPYYLKVENAYSGEGGDPQYFYVLRVDYPPLMISAASSGTVGGVAYTPGDILLHKQGTDLWEMYFDASDVGVKGNVTAFDIAPNNCLALSFATKQSLDMYGLPATVWPQDVVRFCPSHTGEDTAGYFDWLFDGSDVGLTTANEAIDAIAYQGGDVMRLSTAGNFQVPGYDTDLTGRDEDILRFDFSWLGSYTIGAWSLALDGSTVPGLGSEDIAGLWMQYDDVRYVALENGFNVGGVRGDGNDIITITGYEWTGYSVAPFWRGEDAGFRQRIDGFNLPSAPYPIDPYPYP